MESGCIAADMLLHLTPGIDVIAWICPFKHRGQRGNDAPGGGGDKGGSHHEIGRAFRIRRGTLGSPTLGLDAGSQPENHSKTSKKDEPFGFHKLIPRLIQAKERPRRVKKAIYVGCPPTYYTIAVKPVQ
jgi:hypothetical protein